VPSSHGWTFAASLNKWLGGKSYKLAGGGTLKPA
jgi:hypothetical protein